MAGSISRESLRGRELTLGFTVVLIGFGLLAAVGWVVGRGSIGLSVEQDDRSARGVLTDVLVLTALSGVLGMALTEFLKRLLRLREWFNRSAVEELMGPLAEGRWHVTGRGGVPVLPAPLVYSAPLSQLCAQLGQNFGLVVAGIVDRTLRPIARPNSSDAVPSKSSPSPSIDVNVEAQPGPAAAAEALQRDALGILFGSATSDDLIEAIERARPAPAKFSAPSLEPADEALADALILQVERRIDAFQLRTRAKWNRMLQWISASSAAGVVMSLGLAMRMGWPIVVAGVLALLIGGPVSWALRDLVRTIERRAS